MDEIRPPRDDAIEARADELRNGPISELAYTQSVAAAVRHAAKARPAGGLLPWVCIGPRNIGGRIVSMVQDPGNTAIIYAGSAHGGLWRTTDAGDSWTHLGPPSFNTPLGALAMHPDRRNVVYAGTGSVATSYAAGDGLFRITMQADGSAVFDRLANAPLPTETPAVATNGAAARYTRIEVDPDDPERFWVASQTGLWRCRATGTPVVATWVRELPPAAGPAPAGLPALATTPLFATQSDFPAFATDLRIARDPRNAATIVVGGRTVARFLILHVGIDTAGVFRGRYDRSTDSVTWEVATVTPNMATTVAGTNFPATFGRVLIAMCRRQPSNLVVVFQDNNNRASGVFTTNDDGNTWTPQGRIATVDNGQANYSMILEVHPNDPRIIVCGTLNVALSTNGGATFTTILEWPNYDLGDHSQHADQHVAFFDLGNRRALWIGNDGGIALARDVTRPDPARPGFWRKRSHGILAGQFQDMTVHPQAALAWLSAGGLQDNGSWIGYGGPTWYRCGWADGGAIAINSGNPRQFMASQNGGLNLTTVTGTLGPAADLVIESPVINDLPLADPRMRVRVDFYPSFTLTGNLRGPFVGLVEQDPRPGNGGTGMLAWTADQNPPGTFTSPVAVALNAPPNPLPAAPGGLPVATVNALNLPGALAEPGEAGSALAFGPVPGVAPIRVEGWVGTTLGNIFRTRDAPTGPAANPWTAATALPSAGNLRLAPTRFAINPANPAMVAVSAMLAERACQIRISTAGAPGTARYRVRFWNAGAFGTQSAQIATTAAFSQLQRSGLFLSFPAAAYAVGDSWIIQTNGTVNPGAPALAGALQVLPAFGRAITVSITVAGAVGAARFTFQVAGLPVQPALTTAAAVELPVTGVVLSFSGGPFVVGHTFTVNPDNTVTPGGGAVGSVELLARLQSRVFLTYNRGTSWTDISFPSTRAGAGFDADSDSLPPGPITSVRFDVNAGNIDLYAGTLAGIYRTTALPAAAPAAQDVHWRPFNGTPGRELPQTLINDIETVAGTRRLRIASFGRGIWDCDLAAAAAAPRLLMRQTLIEDGQTYPRPFPPPIPDDPRLPAGAAWLDHAHAFDIRIDSAPFDFFDDRVDGVEFDERLPVDALVPLAQQAVYVQVHNWGFDDAVNVDVHLLFAPAGVAVPALLGGAAPAVSMPAGLPDPATLYAPPDFNPAGASPWRRVAPPRRVDRIRPWDPMVVRFDFSPPAALAVAAPNDFVALVALCTAAADALPAALAAGTTLAQFIAAERRAALRVVQIRPRAAARLFIRDGVDDDARLGNVAFAGRSPDLIVVQAEPADAAAAFKDLLSVRGQDTVLIGGANHVYVRVHNAGLEAADAEVHLWSIHVDAFGAPDFAPANWHRLTPAAAPFLTLNVPAAGNALAHVALASPADPTPDSTVKSLALVALIRSTDNTDPLPDTASIDSLDKFRDFFGTLFGSDNAALRVLRART
ncbi:MAG: hypothetical protein JNJ60_04765 [Rhodocyclaceae bacterium]|nr:hypothetical protein [Rhodocyclaceae bacterium]